MVHSVHLVITILDNFTIIITCYALFLKSDWLVALLFLLKQQAKSEIAGKKSEIAGKKVK